MTVETDTVGTGIRSVEHFGFDTTPVLDGALEPGDIILCKTASNPLSTMIAKLDGWWTHTAIFVGDGRIAHSNSNGVTTDILTHLAQNYEAGMGIVRPGLSESERAKAVVWAQKMSEMEGTEYGSADLGVIYNLLRRARAQPGLEELRKLADDAQQESFDSTRDHHFHYESTCSGFAYQAYLRGAGVRLPVVPSPGIHLTDDHRVVAPDTAALIDELLADDQEGLVGRLGDSMRRWITLAEIAIKGLISAELASYTTEPVPIEIAVTPGDLWMQKKAGGRWFWDQAAKDTAEAAVAEIS